MTLLVNLCAEEHPLSRDEFVLPIARIVERAGEVPTICQNKDMRGHGPPRGESVILCGTALQDIAYLEQLNQFSWITERDIPVLGICAGMQVIALLFGGTLGEDREIGMTGIQIVGDDPLFEGQQEFEAFELHILSIVPPPHFHVLAVSSRCSQVIRHPDRCIYGVMFHPEVRHDWVVERFLMHARIYQHGME